MLDSSISDNEKLSKLLKLIKAEGTMSEIAENEIISSFESRGEKAVKTLRENKLIKLILNERVAIWEVEGSSGNYILIDNNYCECKDFQIRVLRRGEKIDEFGKLNIGGILTIDTEKHNVSVEGKMIELTSTEFKILKLFLSNKCKVFSRYDILDYLWGDEKIVLDRTIDVHIKNLREKLHKAGSFIKNIRGIGYKLEE